MRVGSGGLTETKRELLEHVHPAHEVPIREIAGSGVLVRGGAEFERPSWIGEQGVDRGREAREISGVVDEQAVLDLVLMVAPECVGPGRGPETLLTVT